MSVQKEDLHRLIDVLPEKEVLAVKRFLSFVISNSEKEATIEYLNSLPMDDEPLTEGDLKDIAEGEKNIAEGCFKTLEEVEKELGL